MSSSINRGGVLWALSILQPASAGEVSAYLSLVLPEGGSVPGEADLHRFLLEASDMRQVLRVSREPDLFSLTLHGSYFLSREQRLTRDRERLFLLRDSWPDRFAVPSGEELAGLDGAAPSSDARVDIQGSGANKPGPCVPRVRSYWPRISRQLDTGLPDFPGGNPLKLLSFANDRQLELARNDGETGWNYAGLALSLGVSPLLLVQMAVRSERHYRSFDIAKRSGDTRTINAPRVFLKTVQRFISDYVLYDLPVHNAVHSFIPLRSPITNACVHRDAPWIGTIDVNSFFPSIRDEDVERLLRIRGFCPNGARSISRLCTHNGALPQGAPSSPRLSNAYLFQADLSISEMARSKGLAYTRYADDLTFSGNDKSEVEASMVQAERILREGFGLKINQDKSRVMGPSSRRVVTGATVSRVILPGRKLRRSIRAAAFNLSRLEQVSAEKLQRLEGYLNHFDAFDDFRGNREGVNLRRYLTIARQKSRTEQGN